MKRIELDYDDIAVTSSLEEGKTEISMRTADGEEIVLVMDGDTLDSLHANIDQFYENEEQEEEDDDLDDFDEEGIDEDM